MYQNKYKILIIEEEVRNQLAFKGFMREYKQLYEYILAESVFQASSLLSSGDFDIIISDLLVEDGTIFDVIDLAENIPIVISINRGEEEIAAEAIKRGAAKYIVKDENYNYLKLLPVIISKCLFMKLYI